VLLGLRTVSLWNARGCDFAKHVRAKRTTGDQSSNSSGRLLRS
jgi:hypothetical protein